MFDVAVGGFVTIVKVVFAISSFSFFQLCVFTNKGQPMLWVRLYAGEASTYDVYNRNITFAKICALQRTFLRRNAEVGFTLCDVGVYFPP